VLTTHDDSSPIVDRLCDEAKGQNIAITCFYFDFGAREEHSATGILGSLLKQIVGGMERIPEEISRALQDQKKAIGGRRPRLADIVKMLRLITPLQPTFMCIDALDECTGVQRVKLLDSLREILEKSPHIRIFVTGRPHVRTEVEKRLAGRMINVSIRHSKDDIISYLRVRLRDDQAPDAMDEALEAEILEMIPETLSEMWVEAMALRIRPQTIG